MSPPEDPWSWTHELITRCWSTQVIHAVVTLGIADAVGSSRARAEDIARATGTHAQGVFRLLRALAALSLARQLESGEFELTEAGRLLTSDAPGSLRSIALRWGVRTWSGLAHLTETARTGKSAWTHGGRKGFLEMAEKPAEAAVFNRSMADQTLAVARDIVAAYDFAPFKRVFDVGGGYGALLAAVLEAYPHLEGASLDLAYMAPQAAEYLEAAGVADRARFVGCDFFAAVPRGADCYLLKFIIHDWDDEDSVSVLGRCAEALGESGIVLVIEQIVPERIERLPEHEAVIRGDINMMAVTGGRERTRAEYAELFRRAGLALTRALPSRSGFSLIEGKRAS